MKCVREQTEGNSVSPYVRLRESIGCVKAKRVIKRSGTANFRLRYLLVSEAFLLSERKRESMFDKLKEELDLVMERDPAARSRLEVYFLYSGFKAIRSYRKAHWFQTHGMKFIARFISQRSRHKTGIEIHPGATIGKNLFIDHGMGVVIGETTEIGDNCTLYQGVTLGGTGKDQGKRHPTLGNNVLVGSGAKVLGPFKVGDNARIAAGAVVLSEVPANATAVGVPARIVRLNGERINSDLDQIHVSDPVSQELCRLQLELDSAWKVINELSRKINPEKEDEINE